MAFQIGSDTVINNDRKGSFQSVNIGSYTPANRPTGAAAGDVIYNSTTDSIEFFNGSVWIQSAVIPIIATGGAATFSPGDGFKYHVFTGTATFTISSGTNDVDAVIIAGGGGGGAGRDGGGGGAGGMRVVSMGKMAPGSYPVTVGGGGAAMAYWPGYSLANPHSHASVGGTSTFNGFSSTGGGALRGWPNSPFTSPGGSGAGGDFGSVTAGTGTPGQGNPGGAGDNIGGDPENSNCPGGGGGAGGAGTAGSSPTRQPGNGGTGLSIGPLGWTVPTSYGTSGPQPGRYFAGGGAGDGGTYPSNPANASGGTGGGGNAPAGAATASTGSGGAGGYFRDNQNYGGGAGAGGIVIIRYGA